MTEQCCVFRITFTVVAGTGAAVWQDTEFTIAKYPAALTAETQNIR
jgi:hypothetical protein